MKLVSTPVASLLAAIDIAVVATDLDGIVTEWNPGATRLYGWSRGETLGKPLSPLIGCSEPPTPQDLLDGPIEQQMTLRRKNGSLVPVSIRLSAVLDGAGDPVGIVGICSDSTNHDQLVRRAERDALTGLLNATTFAALLENALDHMRDDPAAIPVVTLLDLDRFKAVIAAVGRNGADDVLVALAQRLRRAVSDDAIVARLGGDEFVVLHIGTTSEAEAVTQANALRRALSRRLGIGEAVMTQSATAGVTLAREPDVTADELLLEAAHAVAVAKRRGGGRVEVFDDQARQGRRDDRRLESDLRSAIEAGDLTVAYQPIVDLADGSICGLEALARWRHHEEGDVSPARFVPLAEQSTMMVRLGDAILRMVCGQLDRWRAAGIDVPPVSVNISPRQIDQPDFAVSLQAMVRDADLPPSALRLEITETALMEAGAEPLNALIGLADLGFDVVLDDFGTGYSSLTHLKRLPVKGLKIDHAFVRDLSEDPHAMAIVDAVLTMAKGVGVDVVAEGVETRAQEDLLRSVGCPAAQGWLFSRPLPPERVEGLLRQALPLTDVHRAELRWGRHVVWMAPGAAAYVRDDSAPHLPQPPQLRVVQGPGVKH